MKTRILFSLLCLLTFSTSKAQSDSITVRRIYDIALTQGECYENLRVLCKQVGHRLSGSAQAEKAVVWGK
ncbi:MAG TPA: peptidase M28 family protein, partial [Flavobacteriales bacterium]|nr:peptidase M28 family protein [Flavobacteriales bacterium]